MLAMRSDDGAGMMIFAPTAEEFLRRMAEARHWSLEFMLTHRRAAYVSSCDQYDEPHWELRWPDDDEFDRRDEIAPPVVL